ncbi:hypothetical protein [Coleofasciculus chthonoplastes]|nr:hypothetical protein [Coleofasciculus chthonoplastes]
MLMLSVELRNIGRAFSFPFAVPVGESNSTEQVNLEIECNPDRRRHVPSCAVVLAKPTFSL